MGFRNCVWVKGYGGILVSNVLAWNGLARGGIPLKWLTTAVNQRLCGHAFGLGRMRRQLLQRVPKHAVPKYAAIDALELNPVTTMGALDQCQRLGGLLLLLLCCCCVGRGKQCRHFSVLKAHTRTHL